MKEREQLLLNIDRSYPDFVGAILQYAGKKPARLQAVLDFMEDAAYMSVG